MRSVSFLIKPASSLCNMRCRYCFYKDEAVNRNAHSFGLMSTETADILIDAAFDAVDRHGEINFAFQGGEPTLVGLDFFKHFVSKVKEKNQKKVSINYAFQTNGILIDHNWAAFFAEHNVLVGLSMDGNKTLHDQFRVDVTNNGTWLRVSDTTRLLQKYHVDVNLLCVITKQCAKSGIKMYHALKKTGINYLQFIPCLDPLDASRGTMPWSLTPEDYGSFLCNVFDEWYRDWEKGQYISIRLFDDYIHIAMGMPAASCATSGTCGNYFVIEGDGSVYPCDFYALDQWKIGNIGSCSIAELSNSPVVQRFLRDGLEHPYSCASCRWYKLCFGGCKRDWYTTSSGVHQNYFCSSYQKFFSYAIDRMTFMARMERYTRIHNI